MDTEVEDFRSRAKQSLDAAKTELDSGDAERLPYAVLRLRMALEALTYERAHAYRDFLAAEQYDAWQPKKLMDALLEVDAQAEQGRVLYMIKQPETDEASQPANMICVGVEHVVSLQTLKKHYDALGSFLHMPTMRQLRENRGVKVDALHARCTDVATIVEKVISSTIFNVVPARRVEFPCQRCRQAIVRRVPFGAYDFETPCSSCSAVYRVSGSVDGPFTIHSQSSIAVNCISARCGGTFQLWRDQANLGFQWQCPVCGVPHRLALSPKLDTGAATAMQAADSMT